MIREKILEKQHSEKERRQKPLSDGQKRVFEAKKEFKNLSVRCAGRLQDYNTLLRYCAEQEKKIQQGQEKLQ